MMLYIYIMKESNNKSSKGTAEQMAIIAPFVDYGFKALRAGVLKKNLAKHFVNKGLPIGTAQMLVGLSENKYNEFSHYKAK